MREGPSDHVPVPIAGRKRPRVKDDLGAELPGPIAYARSGRARITKTGRIVAPNRGGFKTSARGKKNQVANYWFEKFLDEAFVFLILEAVIIIDLCAFDVSCHLILLKRKSSKMIRKLKSGEYRLYSRKKDPKTGKRRNLGTFPTRAAAEKHERAVQFFKRKG
jgi:hypothetical protein